MMWSTMIFLTLTTLSASVVVGENWMTVLDEPFNFTCPMGTFLSETKSKFVQYSRDRYFSFGCRDIGLDANITNCGWSDFVNPWDEPVLYQCPNDGIMTGIYGIHDNYREDRRYKFHCCEVEGHIAHACVFTPYLNSYHGRLDYTVEDGWYTRGMESVHQNSQEDRIFRYDLCKLDSFVDEMGHVLG